MGWKRYLVILFSGAFFMIPSGNGKIMAKKREVQSLKKQFHQVRLLSKSEEVLAHSAVYWGRKNKHPGLTFSDPLP